MRVGSEYVSTASYGTDRLLKARTDDALRGGAQDALAPSEVRKPAAVGDAVDINRAAANEIRLPGSGQNDGNGDTSQASNTNSPENAQNASTGQGSATQNKSAAAANDPKVAALIAQLKSTEREVIAHEQAHQAAGGGFAGGASYSYTTGPDGKKYISGGEVSIRTPATDDPEQKVRHAEQVIRAAMAPAEPSGQDRAVAANAAQMAAQGRMEVMAKRMAEQEEAAGSKNEESATVSEDTNVTASTTAPAVSATGTPTVSVPSPANAKGAVEAAAPAAAPVGGTSGEATTQLASASELAAAIEAAEGSSTRSTGDANASRSVGGNRNRLSSNTAFNPVQAQRSQRAMSAYTYFSNIGTPLSADNTPRFSAVA